jgi:hypothetical protein
LNDADATYHPSEGEHFGCATICGTPLLPSTYSIVINVSVLANALGFDITQPQTFVSTLVIDVGEGTANSFSFDNAAGCGGLEVNYEALLSAPAPSLTTYDWEFGNGETSDEALPPTVLYDEPGNYSASLTTTIYDYVLQAVSIANVSDAWGDDIDDLFGAGEADPYFNLIDGNGNVVFTSGVMDNTSATAWNTDIILSTPPYSLQILDADDLSQDDELGATSITLIDQADWAFDVGNGTVGFITISLVASVEFTDQTTVSVFPLPNANLLSENGILYFEDDLASITWYLNEVPVSNAFTSTLAVTDGGVYYAVVTNEFGCSAVSNEYLYCPVLMTNYDPQSQELYVEDIYESYQWYFNGIALEGANNSYVAANASGNYSVVVTTNYGCEIPSEIYILEIGLSENTAPMPPVIYPNPALDKLYINPGNTEIGTLAIYDLTGRIILMEPVKTGGSRIEMDISTLAAGTYVLAINEERLRFTTCEKGNH